jgi:hypothetical protein
MKKIAQKKLAAPSPQIASLVREIEEGMPSWLEDVRPFLQRLNSLSSASQEDFFLFLIKKKPEPLSPLWEVLIGREEKIDLALAKALGHWVSPRAGTLLHRMASQALSKTVLKAIRKSIFLLKSQGLETEEIGKSSPAIYQPPQPTSPEGFLSSIDFTGKRIIWLTKPQPLHGILAFNALVSDLEGILEFSGSEISRREFWAHLQEFQEKYSMESVEADPVYCRGLIAEAAETTQKASKNLPAPYLQWQSRLGPAPALPLRPLIYQYLREEDLKSRTDLLDQSATLFSDPLLEVWILEEEGLRKYLSLLNEASTSRLVLSPYQQEGRLEEIYLHTVQEIFDKPRRLLYQRRLEEVSYLLWKKGKEKQAQMTLVAARALQGELNILHPHPFLLELVKRSLKNLQESEKKDQKDNEGLIIQP